MRVQGTRHQEEKSSPRLYLWEKLLNVQVGVEQNRGEEQDVLSAWKRQEGASSVPCQDLDALCREIRVFPAFPGTDRAAASAPCQEQL